MEEQYNKSLIDLFEGALDCQQGKIEESILTELEDHSERYEEKVFLASGGMKSIYQVSDLTTDRKVAMAVLPENAQESVKESFLREARITAKLQHPNIIPIYDMGLLDGQPFFTMKLLVGETLEDVIRKLDEGDESYIKRFPLSLRVSIFQRVCEAVQYAHLKGIIHLDLKPANIHISELNEVTLCDWGIAKIVDELSDDSHLDRYSIDQFDLNNMTIDGFIKGTPGFMAPEQAGAKGNKDCRTDIYALGALLYNLMTFKKVIDAVTFEEYAEKVLAGEITKPSLVDEKIPSSLEAISMKAVATEPDLRYQNLEELNRDLNFYVNGFATLAEEASLKRQVLLLFNRNKALFSLLFASLLIILLSLSYFLVTISKKEKATQKAYDTLQAVQKDKENLSEQFAQEHFLAAQKSYEALDYDSASLNLKTCFLLQENFQEGRKLQEKLFIASANFAELTKMNSSILKQFPASQNSFEYLQNLLRYLKKNKDQTLYCLAKLNAHKLHCFSDLEKERYLSFVLSLDNPKVQNLQLSLKGEQLDLSNNKGFQDLFAINTFPIKDLNLSGCDIKTIDDFQIKGLRKLDLSYSSLIKLPSLVGVKLEYLDLSYIPLNEINNLADLEVESLNVSGTALKSETLRKYKHIGKFIIVKRNAKSFPKSEFKTEFQTEKEGDYKKAVRIFHFMRMDPNGDKQISKREFAFEEDEFEKWDKNADGFIEYDEFLPEPFYQSVFYYLERGYSKFDEYEKIPKPRSKRGKGGRRGPPKRGF